MKRSSVRNQDAQVRHMHRARKWRRISLFAVIIVLAYVLIFRPFSAAQTPGSEATNSPTLENTESSTQPTDASPDASPLAERSQEFAELYYSYDWQAPDERVKKLAAFGQKDWYATVKQAEKDVRYQSMRKHHTVRTATAELQDTDTNSGDRTQDSGTKTVTLNITVEIQDDSSVQAITQGPFPCTLWWEYDAKSKTWLISQTDPT